MVTSWAAMTDKVQRAGAVTMAALVASGWVGTVAAAADELQWPAQSKLTKPWTFWHWMGNAVDKPGIEAQLKTLHEAGLGGVLIVQIQDVKDPGAVRVPFLSAQWAGLMRDTIREARRLGMDVDMCPTTGWEWGGPWVAQPDAGARIEIASWPVVASARVGPVHNNRNEVLTVMGYAADGLQLDLTEKLGADCQLDWTAPAGHGAWTVYAVRLRRGSCRVKFPTPDGDGWVTDYLSGEAVTHHLEKVTAAMAGFDRCDWPRAWYDDSWEASMSWTDRGLDEFKRRRGYDLRDHLAELSTPGLGDLAGEQWPPTPFLPGFSPNGPSDAARRVGRDFRLTVGELILDGFFRAAGEWAKSHNSQLGCETIDHPGNIVDMAALCDIPFADVGGGPDWWYDNGKYHTGKNLFSRYKVQSSAAHLMGRPLVASETMTCWAVQGTELVGPSFFKIPLKQLKEKIDLDMVGGVNHTMYHSITYSPATAPWPGYLFQAGTQCGPFNPYWPHFAHLNQYVSRCQAFMQAGRPDVDLLFYYPCDDMYMQGRNNNMCFGVEQQLFDRGYDVDYVTDRMLLDREVVKAVDGRLVSPGSSHKALVIGSCKYMEDSTLQQVFDLAKAGATVVVIGDFPQDVAGLYQLEQRRGRLRAMIDWFEKSKETVGPVMIMKTGAGRILKGEDIEALMTAAGVGREKLVDHGLYYNRRCDAKGAIYYISNPPGHAAISGWIPLAATGKSAAIFDAMTGQAGMAACRKQAGNTEVYLQLEPSSSLIVRVFDQEVNGPDWRYMFFGQGATPITGTWNVEFVSGGDKIPAPEQCTELSSWTTWTSSPQYETLKYFSGIARYSITFGKPADDADEWFIDLGDVRNSARVSLNRTSLGVVYGAPNNRVRATGLLKPVGNRLTVEVANLAHNRVAGLDAKHTAWNVVPALFGSMPRFDQVLDAGLLGPVRLVPASTKPAPAMLNHR